MLLLIVACGKQAFNLPLLPQIGYVYVISNFMETPEIMNLSRKSFRRMAGLFLMAMAACGPGQVSMECSPYATPAELMERPSPYDSVAVTTESGMAKLCYSRPYAKGRVVFGGELVPWDVLWRTGANEATIVHLNHAAEIAGLSVGPGSYSIYTVPSEGQWVVVVNASTGQWGQTRDMMTPGGTMSNNSYTSEVEAEEVGRSPIATEQIDGYVEQLTARFGPSSASGADLLFEWETTRIVIPLRFVG